MKQTLRQAFVNTKAKIFPLNGSLIEEQGKVILRFCRRIHPASASRTKRTQGVSARMKHRLSPVFGTGSMVKSLAVVLLLLLPYLAAAQLQDDFSDGNFTQNPTWTGDISGFVVNAQHQLQSNGPAVTGTMLYLATPSQAAVGTVWEFWANLRLATSASNYADIFLIADKEELKAADVNGYFVRIGNTADEVSLFRKDAGKSPVVIINGEDKTVATSNNMVRVRVTRSLAYTWQLEIDVSGTGSTT